MLKLLALILALFFTMPAFAMRAITSRSPQRGYATMTKKDFKRLVEYQKNGRPLSPNVFAFQLGTMKKDNEDLKKLWINLSSKVKALEGEYTYSELVENVFVSSITAPGTLLGTMLIAIALVQSDDVVYNTMYLFSLPVLVIGGCASLQFLLESIKDFADINKDLRVYKKNLTHIASLIDEVVLEKIKKENRE